MTDLPVRRIAIDGPAASGKTAVGRLLAAKLGCLFFDTGVMYRAVALAAYQNGVNPADERAVSELAESVSIDVRPSAGRDERANMVLLDGDDVSWAIRESVVDETVAQVSAYARVRAAMTAQQRAIGMRGNVVMVGRDVGTVVLPEADLKIYLEASREERVRRRHAELESLGSPLTPEDVRDDLVRRDEADSRRGLASLRPAPDAIVIDATELTPEAVVEKVLQALKERG